MEKHLIYCSACDREVEVLLRDGVRAAGATGKLEGAVCMDIGELCTGTSCPICASAPAQIRSELAQIRSRPGDA